MKNIYTFLYCLFFAVTTATAQLAAPMLSAQVGDGTVTLTWNKVSDNNGIFKEYIIYGGLQSNPTTALDSSSWYDINDTTYLITGLTNYQTYYYRVTSKTDNGVESSYSNEVTVMPRDFTSPPSLTGLKVQISDGSVSLVWDAVDNTAGDFSQYLVYMGNQPNSLSFLASSGPNSYFVNNLTNGTLYYFAVSAADTSGNNSSLSATVSAMPAPFEIERNDSAWQANNFDKIMTASLSPDIDSLGNLYGDVDMFRFAVKAGSRYSFTTSEASVFYNPVAGTILSLYYQGDTINAVAQNRPAGYYGYSNIVFEATADTVVYLKVEATTLITGDYMLLATWSSPDAWEPNNDMATASFVHNGDFVSDLSIFPQGDIDYYTFNAKVNQTVSVSWFAEYDATVKLYDATGKMLTQAKLSNFGQKLVWRLAADGSYFIVVESGGGEVIGNYAFSLDMQNPSDLLSSPVYSSGWNEPITGTFDGALPTGWQTLNYNNDNTKWSFSLSGGVDLSNALVLGSATPSNDDWLVFPAFVVPQNGELQMMLRTDAGKTETLECWVGEYTTTSTSLLNRLSVETVSNTNFFSYIVDLSIYAGDTVRVALRSVSAAQGRLFADNFSLVQGIAGGRLSGNVLDLNTAQPLANVKVTMGEATAYTDALGNYQLKKQPAGLMSVVFEKAGYQRASFWYDLKEGSNQYNVKLNAITAQRLYYSGFESADDKGASDTVITGAWRVSGAVNTSAGLINPAQGSSMLLFGGENYIDGFNTAWTNLTFGSMDMTQCLTAKMSYTINHDFGDGDKLYPVILRNNQINYLDLNHDGIAGFDDFYKGTSNVWRTDTIDISAFCGLQNGTNVELGFLAMTNSKPTINFGAAIDRLAVDAQMIKSLAPPQNLKARSYIEDTVKLSWNAAVGAEKYHVFRHDGDGVYRLIATRTTRTYNDLDIVNGKRYYYQVSAVASYDESLRSDEVYADAGVPQMLKITTDTAYIENFEQEGLPQNWLTSLGRYQWTSGGQNAMNMKLPLPETNGAFLFVKDNDVFGTQYNADALVTSPWLDVSSLTGDLFVRYKTFSKNVLGEQHYLMIRSMTNGVVGAWQKLDSVQNTTNWQLMRKIYALQSKKAIQLGFRFTNNNTEPFGWVIDSLQVSALSPGGIDGYITSSAGKPVYNAKVSVAQTNLVARTDADGYYSFKPVVGQAFPLYSGFSYDVQVQAYGYVDTLRKGILVEMNQIKRTDIVLNYKEAAPRNLVLGYDTLTRAVLKWDEPEAAELVRYDDGQADTLVKAQSRNIKMLFNLKTTVPVKLAQLQMQLGNGQFNGQLSYLAVYKVKGLDTTFFVKNTSNTPIDSLWRDAYNANAVWGGANADCVIDTSRFWVEIKTSLATPMVFGGDKTSVAEQYQFVNGQWKRNTIPFIVRLKLNTGGEFRHKYNVYKNSGAGFEPLVFNLSVRNYTDTKISVGGNATYTVRASYNTGESSNSNEVKYDLQSFPMLDERTYEGVDTSMAFGAPGFVYGATFKNIGISDLTYNVQYVAGYLPDQAKQLRAGLQENDKWARVRCFDNLPAVGDTGFVTFYLENEYRQSSYGVVSVEVNIPAGVNLLASTNMVQSGDKTGKQYLFTNKATGSGVTLRWADPDGDGLGNILPDETAWAKLQVAVTPQYNGGAFSVRVLGDMPHLKQNTVESTVRFDRPPFGVFFNPTQGKIKPKDSVSVRVDMTMNTQGAGFYPGYLLLKSDAVNVKELRIPFNAWLSRGLGEVSGTLSNLGNGQVLANVPLWLTDTMNTQYRFVDTTDANGAYQFTGVTVGNYKFNAEVKGYLPLTRSLKVESQGQIVTINAAMQPDLRAPLAVKTKDNSTNITVSWKQRTVDAFDSFEGGDNSPVSPPWSIFDSDGDGVAWSYKVDARAWDGSGFLVARSQATSDDWLFSPQLLVTRNSRLSFRALNLGTTADNVKERFMVRLSYKGVSDVDFGQPIFTYEFSSVDGWQLFDIPLNIANDYDTVYVAIQRLTENKAGLAIDALKITNLSNLPIDMNEPFVPVASIEGYDVYRSPDGVGFELMGSVAGDKLQYVDNKAVAGLDYWYRVSAQYNLGKSPFSEVVAGKMENKAPVIQAIEDKVIDEDGAINIPVTYSDANGNFNLSLSVKAVIERFDITVVNNIVSIKPFADWNGASRISVIVSDGLLSDTADFKLTVNAVNDLPVITSPAGGVGFVGQLFEYKLTATDIDKNDVLTYTANNVPAWLSFVADSAKLRGTPALADAGKTYLIDLGVNDGTATVNKQLSITVGIPNTAPVFVSTPLTIVEMTKEYVYTVVARDADNDAVIFDAITKPSWLTLTTINDSTARLSGFAPFNGADTIVVISAGDGINTPNRQQFIIQIKTIGVKDAIDIQIRLFPNPVHETLFLTTQEVNTTKKIRIFDNQGRVWSENDWLKGNTEHRINVKSLNEGLYWILVETDGKRYMQPFVVKK